MDTQKLIVLKKNPNFKKLIQIFKNLPYRIVKQVAFSNTE